MNNKKKKIKKRYIAGIVLSLVLGALLITIVLSKKELSFFGNTPMNAGMLYLVLILVLLLPVFLLLMLVSVLMDDRKNRRKPKILHLDTVSTVLAGGMPVMPTAGTAPLTAAPAVSAAHSTPQPAAQQAAPQKREDADAEGDADEEEAGRGRFCKLNHLDEIRMQFRRAAYDEGITLRQFCDNFRNYAASRLKLYYDISDIRRFIAGMAVSHILILQGMSGTGKTSLAHAFGDFLENTSTVIPVQPMWKERTDLVGYYNEFTKRFNETTLLEKMYEANYSEDIYVTVLDEMNIARVEYYFAEFLSLLELPNAEERLLTVVSDVWEDDPAQLTNGCIKLPPNMWFIGTANNDDSTFAISDKVYDRAMILNLDSKCEPFVAPKTGKCHVSAKQFERMTQRAMKEYEITARNMRRLEELDKYLIEHFHITFGNRIMKQIKCYIPVFVACGGDELAALDDILSKKVLRKLEMQNPIYLRSASGGLCAYFDELFGDDRMPLCKAFMERLQRTI